MNGSEVVITGVGPISALGLGAERTWASLTAGRSGVGSIEAFDASGFASRIGGEVEPFRVRDFVPRSYRKATKVMARDIELAVAAADMAARDGGLITRGTAPDGEPSYPPARMGAHIGAGLIAAELNELTAALSGSVDERGRFDLHRWGREGMANLTPLWLLKYLPNMLACHVTIIHDAQGPSNTITCNEPSGVLSLGESLRVIRRGAAEACFCGGCDSKINPMGFLRQQFTGRLNETDDDRPAEAVRPFAADAAGGAAAEGGGIVVLEDRQAWARRGGGSGGGEPYATLAGFAATQTVHRPSRNHQPDPEGRSIAAAMRGALRNAGLEAGDVDLVIPFGCADPVWDAAEAEALKAVFGERLGDLPVRSNQASAGNCGAGAGALDLCVAGLALRHQQIPAAINCDPPIAGLRAGTEPARDADLRTVLCCTTGLGGQNAAVVLKRFEDG